MAPRWGPPLTHLWSVRGWANVSLFYRIYFSLSWNSTHSNWVRVAAHLLRVASTKAKQCSALCTSTFLILHPGFWTWLQEVAFKLNQRRARGLPLTWGTIISSLTLKWPVAEDAAVLFWFSYELISCFFLVRPYNRSQMCFAEKWLSDLTVWVGYEFSPVRRLNIQSLDACAHLSGQVSDGKTATIHCKHNTVGRFVILYVKRARYPLSLCEVAVYGTKGI